MRLLGMKQLLKKSLDGLYCAKMPGESRGRMHFDDAVFVVLTTKLSGGGQSSGVTSPTQPTTTTQHKQHTTQTQHHPSTINPLNG
jgi:hypothetical protein